MNSDTQALPEQTVEDLGPRHVGNAKLVYKTMLGIIGGIAGTLVIFIVMLMASSLSPNIFDSLSTAADPGTAINPILLYIVLAMVFLATIVGNLASTLLFYIADREKYRKLTTHLTQAFIFNLLIFVFSVPLYLIIQGSSVTTLVYVIGIHFLLSAFISAIVMEILTMSNYVLVGVYGNTFGILAALVINLVLFISSKDSAAFMLFFTMPLIWGCIGFFQSIIEMLYRWFYEVYGVDFLNLQAQYEEAEKETEEEEEK